MSQYPPQSYPPPGSHGGNMRPHRGAMILVLGILGLLLCFILGIIAWVMASGDLRQMDTGAMDPTGRGLTQAGKVLGIVATILNLLWMFFFVPIVIGIFVAAIGAASSGGP